MQTACIQESLSINPENQLQLVEDLREMVGRPFLNNVGLLMRDSQTVVKNFILWGQIMAYYIIRLDK